MDLNLIIIKATLADVDTLLNISRSTFFEAFAHLNHPADMEAYAAKAFNTDKLGAELKNSDSKFYLAYVDDLLAGYLKLNVGNAQTEPLDNSLEIERIYIVAKYQGKKLGQRLIDFALNIAKSQQLASAWLGVWENNTGAIKFYQRNGFLVFGSHEFWLGNDKQTDLLMRKPLYPFNAKQTS